MNFLMGAWDGHESLFEMQLLLSVTKTKQKCSRRDEIFTMGGYRKPDTYAYVWRVGRASHFCSVGGACHWPSQRIESEI